MSTLEHLPNETIGNIAVYCTVVMMLNLALSKKRFANVLSSTRVSDFERIRCCPDLGTGLWKHVFSEPSCRPHFKEIWIRTVPHAYDVRASLTKRSIPEYWLKNEMPLLTSPVGRIAEPSHFDALSIPTQFRKALLLMPNIDTFTWLRLCPVGGSDEWSELDVFSGFALTPPKLQRLSVIDFVEANMAAKQILISNPDHSVRDPIVFIVLLIHAVVL